MQQRADKLCTGGGFTTVIPTFAIEPLRDENLDTDILYFNFYKEFYEELYDKEELVKDNRRLSENWFFQEEPIKTLISLREKGEFKLHVIGFGIDALTGELNISILALIDNTDFFNNELGRMKYNWEVNGVSQLDFRSSDLDELFQSGLLQPSSAFCITNVQKILSQIIDKP